MKKTEICILIIVLSFLVLGLIAGFTYLLFTGSDFHCQKSQLHIVQEKIFSLDNIDHILLDLGSADVQFYPSNNTDIRIVQYSNKKKSESHLFLSEEDENTLRIKDPRKRQICFFVCFFEENSYEVYLPSSYQNDLSVSTISGDITLDSNFDLLSLRRIVMQSVSGDLLLKSSITSQQFDLKTTSGEIQWDHIQSQKLEVKTTSGDIEAGTLKIEQGNIHSISGDIEIDKINGQLRVKTTSGDIDLMNFKITQDSTVESISGDIKLILHPDSHCQIVSKTVSGDTRLPNGSSLVGDGTYRLNIKTTSGDILIQN